TDCATEEGDGRADVSCLARGLAGEAQALAGHWHDADGAADDQLRAVPDVARRESRQIERCECPLIACGVEKLNRIADGESVAAQHDGERATISERRNST